MDRSLGDLQVEAGKLGLNISLISSSKDDIEIALRDFYWNRNHPGEQMLLQVDPMKAAKLRDLSEEKQEKVWLSKKWGAQLKLNGCRIIAHLKPQAFVDGRFNGNRFTTRGKSVTDFLFGETTHNLPYHRDADLSVLGDTVLDGEIISPYAVVQTKHTTTRKPLQVAMVVVNPNSSEGASIQEKYGPMEYHAWDVIRYQGRDVTVLPYDQRIELLKAVFTVINKNAELARLFKYVPVIMENKQEFYNDVVAKGGEGIILKDMTAVYRLGARPTTLLKVKRFEELDAFVVGFTPGKEGKALEDLVGGLVFAVYDEETGTQNVIGNISGLPMEFRRAATIPCQPVLVPSSKEFIIGATDRKGGTRTISYTINPEFLGKVATIQGQEFTPRNFRFAHCRFTTAYKSNGKFHPWREDKTRNECKEDIKKIAASAGLVEA